MAQSLTAPRPAATIWAQYYALTKPRVVQLIVFCALIGMLLAEPGWPDWRLVGLGSIRAAFDAMFSNGSIRAWPERVRKVESMASAMHNVLERIEILTEGGPATAYVLATNVYHRTGQGWRMVAHHASPGTQNEAQEVNETPPVLH